MRRVCFYNFQKIDDFHGYQIESFNVQSYFPKSRHGSLSELLSSGWNGYYDWNKLSTASGLDMLYQKRDPAYMKFAADFVNKFHDFDIIIMSTFCPIHPEILYHELKHPIKVLGFQDDPVSSYVRGIPYLWAFDAACYISPSYSQTELLSEKLTQWGCQKHFWRPLVSHQLEKVDPDEAFFQNRDIDLVYVGKAYSPKIGRLIRLKKKYGDRFQIHGHWPLNGYYGFARALLNKPIFPYRVTPISLNERTKLFHRAKIGFNMHLSEMPKETGNMRMYETTSHGMMMVCDKAGRDAHAQIFTPDKEAVFYDSIDDAIDKIDYYLANDMERIRIAKAGFNRATTEYDWENSTLRLLDWAYSLKKLKEVDSQ